MPGIPISGSAGARAVAVLRLLPDGRLDHSFGLHGGIRTQIGHFGEGLGVAVQRHDRIVVAAAGAGAGAGALLRSPYLAAVRYLPSGRRDHSFFGNGIFSATFGAPRSLASTLLLRSGQRRIVLVGEAANGADPGAGLDYPLLVGLRG
jgi:hypothetical protein